jgi:formamidopyrimidine-DNA glycosylase
MPEVVEIAITAQYLLSKLKNKEITEFKVLSGRYTHQDLEGEKIIKNNLPIKIKDIDSKGKFMWFELKNQKKEIYLMNTFGLTGEWSFEKQKNSRLEIKVDDKYLYFTDDRNFGTIIITDEKDDLDKKINKLADDVLKTEFTEEEYLNKFKAYVSKSKTRKNISIVKFLMEQDKTKSIGSGIGNYLSVEILYRAKISPHRQLGDLSDDEIKEIAYWIKKVTKLCYLSNVTGYMIRLEDYVKPHREKVEKGELPEYHKDIKIKKDEEFEFLVYRQKKDKHGNEVKNDEIIKGRSTYWVPKIQK